MAKTDAQLEEFVVIYEAVDKLLSVLRCHKYGPPGIKGIQGELKSVCQDVLDQYEALDCNQTIKKKFYEKHTDQFEVAAGDTIDGRDYVYFYHTITEQNVRASLDDKGELVVENSW